MDLAVEAVFALLLGCACAVLSWEHVRRIRRATSGKARSLALALKKLPEQDRLAELLLRAPEGSWEQKIARDALAAADDPGRVAAVNDALFDVEHELRKGAGWSSAALRISLFGGMLLGVITYQTTGKLGAALAIAGVGVLSALASLEAGRSARRATEEQRAAVDALIATVLGKLVEAAPSRSRSRFSSAGRRGRGAGRRAGAGG